MEHVQYPVISADEEAFNGFLDHIGGKEAIHSSQTSLIVWPPSPSPPSGSRSPPIATVRLAFSSLFTAEPISLPGIQPATSSTGATGGGGEGKEGGAAVGPQDGGHARGRRGAQAKYGMGKVAYVLLSMLDSVPPPAASPLSSVSLLSTVATWETE